MKKKRMKWATYVAIVCMVTVLNVMTVMQTEESIKWLGPSLVAISESASGENDGGNEGESGGSITSCTVTYICVDIFNIETGSISCTGYSCSRGIEKEGIFIITERRYVECDGHRTYC